MQHIRRADERTGPMSVPTLESMQAADITPVGLRHRHPHAMAVLLAFAVVASLVSGPFVYGAITDKHTDGRWVLDSAPAPIPRGLTITIEGDEIHGEGPCNTFGAAWSQSDALGEMGGTLIGCPPHVAEQEDAYFTLLGDAGSVEVDDDRMTLSGRSGRLIYVRID